jgi:hypothetical protein
MRSRRSLAALVDPDQVQALKKPKPNHRLSDLLVGEYLTRAAADGCCRPVSSYPSSQLPSAELMLFGYDESPRYQQGEILCT